MNKAWEKIIELRAINAKHRKGFRINEISQTERINQAIIELLELKDSRADFDDGLPPEYDIYELADAFAILLHFAQFQGWELDKLDAAIVKKLEMRFS